VAGPDAHPGLATRWGEADGPANTKLPGRSRRDFLKVFGCAGCVFLCRPKDLLANGSKGEPLTETVDFQFRSVDIRHLTEMKDVLDKLNRERRVSQQKIIQGYLKDLEYQAPQSMPNARSLTVVSTPAHLRSVGFRWHGMSHTLLVPGGYFYYDNEAFRRALLNQVAGRVAGNANAKMVFSNPPLKTVAVRSGLAEYGKNNITYVEGYGSFHILWAFFSEEVLPDQWSRPYRTMRVCEGCSLCSRGAGRNDTWRVAGSICFADAEHLGGFGTGCVFLRLAERVGPRIRAACADRNAVPGRDLAQCVEATVLL